MLRCSLWKYLDELAGNDPEAYKQFLAKQASSYKEEIESKQDKRMDGLEPGILINTRQTDIVPSKPLIIQVFKIKEGKSTTFSFASRNLDAQYLSEQACQLCLLRLWAAAMLLRHG
jgi:hypothetical protein